MGLARWELRRTRSDNRPDYEPSFVRRAHDVLSMGYARLHGPSFVRHEEEQITGELTRAMQAAVQDPDAPRWAKHFWPSEETRVHEPGRLGKHRRRIDIEIMQHGLTRRPRFRFEAKRLHDSASRREYFGDGGLGCFLDGTYAKDDQTAGMLGYVQEGSVAGQAGAMADALKVHSQNTTVRLR